MAVSVRMDPVLEQELEAAAKRQGLSKSQFIVDAVERALGRKDAYRLLLKAQQAYGLTDPASDRTSKKTRAASEPSSARMKAELKAKHDASLRDWLAYQAAKKQGRKWVPDEEDGGRKAGA